MRFTNENEHAKYLDDSDPMSDFRNKFYIDDQSLIYMDGNSLGRLPKQTIDQLNDVVVKQWGKNLIRSWNDHWINAPVDTGEKVAQILGAAPGQTIISDSTSFNLYKLINAALQINNNRKKIISDDMNFPSDLYILQGIIQSSVNKHELVIIPSNDGISMNIEKLLDAIDQDTAVVTLSHVTFKSGFLYDIARVTEKAHQMGALVLWDLCHSAGVVPIHLDKWDVDYAVGCTYKYINGGPGAPAFLYVKKALQKQSRSPVWGWFGSGSPFNFNLDYLPAEDIKRFTCGTPPILSLQAIQSGIDMINEAGIEEIRRKSIDLCEYLIELFDLKLLPLGFVLGSPRASAERGSHISIRHPNGYQINQCLISEKNVIPDFRQPDNIRLGLSPLYTTFKDICETVNHIEMIIQKDEYQKYTEIKQQVT